MHYIIYLIPFIGAFIGWLVSYLAIHIIFHPIVPKKFFGIQFQGILPKNQKQIANTLGGLASEGIKPYISELEANITSSSNIDKMMPFVEKHIDHFLRVKLAEKMPVISMFIGESTIAELKSVFLEELESLFPELMKHYMEGMKEEFDLNKIVVSKIESIHIEKVKAVFYDNFQKYLTKFMVVSMSIGFILGLIQLSIAIIAR